MRRGLGCGIWLPWRLVRWGWVPRKVWRWPLSSSCCTIGRSCAFLACVVQDAVGTVPGHDAGRHDPGAHDLRFPVAWLQDVCEIDHCLRICPHAIRGGGPLSSAECVAGRVVSRLRLAGCAVGPGNRPSGGGDRRSVSGHVWRALALAEVGLPGGLLLYHAGAEFEHLPDSGLGLRTSDVSSAGAAGGRRRAGGVRGRPEAHQQEAVSAARRQVVECVLGRRDCGSLGDADLSAERRLPDRPADLAGHRGQGPTEFPRSHKPRRDPGRAGPDR